MILRKDAKNVATHQGSNHVGHRTFVEVEIEFKEECMYQFHPQNIDLEVEYESML